MQSLIKIQKAGSSPLNKIIKTRSPFKLSDKMVTLYNNVSLT